MKKFVCASLMLGFAAAPAWSQEVILRHSLEGKALDALATATLKFNDLQRGKARVVLQSATNLDDATRAQLPHLALLDTDEAFAFFNTKPRYVPLYKVMSDAGEKFDPKSLYPVILDAVDDAKGRPEALPVGQAFPALFRNKALFAKAGIDPEKPPRTWMEVQEDAGKLFDSGVRCPFTTANVSRLHTENVSAQHGQTVTDKRGATLNTLVNVKHLALLSSWYKSSYFKYYGPHREAEARFLSGECAMITTDTSLYARLASRPELQADGSAMPYHDDVYTTTPEVVLPDGASVWVLAGKKKEEYKVAARFLKFFSEPAQQRDWVQATAYLPMSPAAMAALREAKAFTPRLLERAERRLVAVNKDSGRFHSEAERSRMRDVMNEEIETIWQNKKPPMEALNNAMQRVNGR